MRSMRWFLTLLLLLAPAGLKSDDAKNDVDPLQGKLDDGLVLCQW